MRSLDHVQIVGKDIKYIKQSILLFGPVEGHTKTQNTWMTEIVDQVVNGSQDVKYNKLHDSLDQLKVIQRETRGNLGHKR